MADEEKTETTEETPVEETPVAETPRRRPRPPSETPGCGGARRGGRDACRRRACRRRGARRRGGAPRASAAEPEAPAEPQRRSRSRRRSSSACRVRSARKKTRVKRPAPTGERKPISREPKPEHDRGRRQERRGVVVSDAMDKTIVVKVDTIRAHPRYKKVIRRSTKFHAHDEANTAKVGDLVRIVETRPLSKTKNWRLAEIVEAAK